MGCLLFGRVCQLIFSPSVVALCDALVVPQVLHRLHVGRLKRRHRLEVDGANQVRAILEKRGNSLIILESSCKCNIFGLTNSLKSDTNTGRGVYYTKTCAYVI